MVKRPVSKDSGAVSNALKKSKKLKPGEKVQKRLEKTPGRPATGIPKAGKVGAGRGQPSGKSGEGKKSENGKKQKGAVVLLNKQETREKMKATKAKRKSAKESYEDTVEIKKIWELLRRKQQSTSQDDSKDALCAKVLKRVKGKEKQFLYAHDTSRVLQCVHKYGSKARQAELFECVKGELLQMAKSKYSAPLVKRMVKRGTGPQKRFIIAEFMSNARALMKHKTGGQVVEYIYNMYANAAERFAFAQQFYGPTFRLLNHGKNKSLSEVLSSEPHQRGSILRYLRDCLVGLVRKDALGSTLVHSLFLDYFTHCESEEERIAMAETLAEYVPAILHTRDGARVCLHTVWYGSAKARKTIVKSLKEDGLAVKAAKEEHGHLVLLAIFDAVDDTKLILKVVVASLMGTLEELVGDRYGRRVLHYLLCPRDSAHFPPDVVRLLEKGDGNPISKKDAQTRRDELADGVGEPLAAYVKANAEELTGDGPRLLLAQSVAQYGRKAGGGAPARECMQALAELAARKLTVGDGHIVENAAAHIAFKKLLAHDKEHPDREDKFVEVFLEVVPKETICSFLECNRGCFLLLCMLETENAVAKKKLTAMLKSKKKALAKQSFKGASLLLKHL